MSGETGFAGFQRPEDAGSEYNAIAFLIQQHAAKMQTSTVVKIVAVTNAGALSPVGYVDVIPQVNQVDGAGKAEPHGIIHNIPYSRLQGGTNAVIMDPAVGDLGIAVFASRDISSVKKNKGQSNPGSGRRNSMADGMYVGGLLNGTPTQYVQFEGGGVTIHSPVKITLSAPDIAINGNTALTGTLSSNGHDISNTHLHTKVQVGGALSGPPQ